VGSSFWVVCVLDGSGLLARVVEFLHSRWALPELDRDGDVRMKDAPALLPLSWFDQCETDTETTLCDSDLDYTTEEDEDEDFEVDIPGAIVKSPPQPPPRPTRQQAQSISKPVAAAATTTITSHSRTNSSSSSTSLSSGYLSDGAFEAALIEECKRFDAAEAAKATITTNTISSNNNNNNSNMEDDSSEISSTFEDNADIIDTPAPTARVGRNGRTRGLLWCEMARWKVHSGSVPGAWCPFLVHRRVCENGRREREQAVWDEVEREMRRKSSSTM
jgi:hypothetical protein